MRIIKSAPLSDLGQAALAYATEGLRVLPCVPGRKTPMIKNWPVRATRDASVVARWWSAWPSANVALITGTPGYDVLDVDVRPSGSGLATLDRLEAEGRLSEPIKVVRTPSGGQHWYFNGTGQPKTKLTGQFIDFMAVGGYVLAPPSRVRVDGELKSYEVIRASEHGGDCLDWGAVRGAVTSAVPLRRQSSRSGSRGGRRRHWMRYLRESPVGERNLRLFTVANRFVESGRDPAALVEVAKVLGLSEMEIRHTISSAIRQSGGALRG